MPYLWLTHSDGRHYVRLLSDEEGRNSDDTVLVEDRVYDAYLKHIEQDRVWQAFWNAIDNEQAMRRQMEKLQPLEDAQREIERLKAELDRHKRQEIYWQNAYAGKQTAAHREEYQEFTHVYPQPGCKIAALRDLPGVHPEWIERAEDILEAFDVERMEGGMKYQGCCCEHKHILLKPAEVQMLRDAGFLVETDTEVV